MWPGKLNINLQSIHQAPPTPWLLVHLPASYEVFSRACSQSNGYKFLVATQSVHIQFHIIQLQIWTEHRVTLLTIRNLFVESYSRSLFKSEKQNFHILNLITHLQRFVFHHLHFHNKARTNHFSFRFETKRIHRRIYITNSATWSKIENSPNVLEMPSTVSTPQQLRSCSYQVSAAVGTKAYAVSTNPSSFIEAAPQKRGARISKPAVGYVSLSLEGEGEKFMNRHFQRPYFENKQFVWLFPQLCFHNPQRQQVNAWTFLQQHANTNKLPHQKSASTNNIHIPSWVKHNGKAPGLTDKEKSTWRVRGHSGWRWIWPNATLAPQWQRYFRVRSILVFHGPALFSWQGV